MKWITNNFSLNMVQEDKDFTLKVVHLTELTFKVESKQATVRLSHVDICQEIGIAPHSGNVSAQIGDTIFVAQTKKGQLTYRKIIIGEIQ